MRGVALRVCAVLAATLVAWCQAGPITTASAVTATAAKPRRPAENIGYWVVRANGSVSGHGLPSLGDLSRVKLPSPIVGGAAVPGGGGYWLVAANGGVYSFGDARFFGSPGGKHLNRPVVGMAATPDGRGYWLVASDGGIFAYGDAKFFGSTGHVHLKRPVVGMAATPDGRGYWLVASDGGTFTFGDAAFMGSAGAAKLASKVVGIAPARGGKGYWVAERDGTVLPFGSAQAVGGATTERNAREARPSAAVTILAPGPLPTAGTIPLATTTSLPSSSPSSTAAPPVATSQVPPSTTTTTLPTTTLPTALPTTSTSVPAISLSPSAYPAGTTGYDVSWPQCSPLGSSAAGSLPAASAFEVVGVNGGTIGSFNSCFAAEAAWAAKSLSVYIILQPAPSNSPVQETTGPEAACAATSSECEGYDWGYNYAEADLAFVKGEGYSPRVWWVDVETGEGWPTSPSLQPVNAAIVQGALDAVRSSGAIAGIYSTWYQWGKITGSYLPGGQPPIWVPGAYTLSGGNLSAVAYCQRADTPGDPSTLLSPYIGFAGGAPWLVQYGYGGAPTTGVDPDYACG